MRIDFRGFGAIWAVLFAFGAILRAPARIQERGDTPLTLVQTVPLPGVEGRIDHFSADLKSGRLFVAALGNNTVEVLDLKTRKRSGVLTGMREPQGVAVDGDTDDVFWDAGRKLVCVSGGASFLGVVRQRGSDDNYKRIAHLPTAVWARTSLFVP